ncbi:MAG TPA: hypothetical protein VIJ00_09805 [Nakamurella sp.]
MTRSRLPKAETRPGRDELGPGFAGATSRPSWGSLAVVAPGSLAFLAAAVMWVSGHDPRASAVPTEASGPTAAASTTMISGPAGSGDVALLGQDAAASLQLARLQVLLGQAEAQLLLLDQGAGAAVLAPSPVLADVPPPAAAAVQPSVAPVPVPAAHAVTGASGA